MQLSIVVFGLAVLVAVLVKSGDARAALSSDELLDELTDHLLARYLESRNLDQNVQRINTRGRYDDGPGPVRRWWNRPSSSSTSNTNTNTNSNTASNTGDISNISANGMFAAGSNFGTNQGRK